MQKISEKPNIFILLIFFLRTIIRRVIEKMISADMRRKVYNIIMNEIRKFEKLPPSIAIMLGFAAMIIAGAALLTLPIASRSGQSTGFLDALFTAASANCVTGLVVVNTLEHWSVFGKLVILALIQLGGMGFMTILTLLLMLFRKNISLRSRLVIQASYNLDTIGGMVSLVRNVAKTALLFEGVGAVALSVIFYFSQDISPLTAVWQGVFHSISAFCNAGFDLIGAESMTPFAGNFPVNFTICALIVSGGLGFTVWQDIFDNVRRYSRRSVRTLLRHLSLHSKMAISMTVILIAAGTVLFLAFEWSNPRTIGSFSLFDKVQAAAFQSVTLRTAGFNTIPQGEMVDVSQALSCILMMIGGSPVSTAGGAKTVTVGIIMLSVIAALAGRDKIEGFGRSVSLDLLQKALTVTCALLLVVFCAVIMLHFTEMDNPFRPTLLDLTFEVCSATATVGVTTGVTPHLSNAGKLIITLCMYLGRLGPLSVIVAINSRLHKKTDGLVLPGERVVIG